jgi:hypothetical protein
MRSAFQITALALLLVLLWVLVSPTSESLLAALRSKEKAGAILMSMALAAMLLIGVASQLYRFASPAYLASIDLERNAYPPLYTLECVLRC